VSIRSTAAVFLICSGQAAIAGGIDVPPNFYDWTGVYIGGNVGYGTGSISDSATSSTQSFSGLIAGGQIGANLQYRNVLFGVEVDGDWTNQQGSGTSLTASMSWLATARMRLGFAYDNISYYATGGAGYTRFASGPIGGAASSSARTAWVAGLGQESAINRNLILRIEVLYLQLLGGTPTSAVSSADKVYDVGARLGLSYKFNWP
jgi:outer membrane immunogenic protein